MADKVSVINYEEGGEHSLDQGDSEGEAMLQEIGTGKTPYVGQRDTREFIAWLLLLPLHR